MSNMTSNDTYGVIAKTFHWLVAGLLAAQYAVGWLMPHITRNTPKVGLVSWHVSLGATILAVLLLRLIWRLAFPVMPDTSLSGWELAASRITHAGLYILVVAMTVLGWAAAGYYGWEVDLFGLVPLPSLAAKGASWAHTAGDVHNGLQWFLLAFIVLHIAAALYHYTIKRDQVLQRMLP